MSAQTAIAAAYDLLKTVPECGPNVYDQIRYSNDDAEFKALFVDAMTDPANPAVRTWMVNRDASPARDKEMQAWGRTHTIAMTGYYAFKDGVSSPVWEAAIEAVVAAFGPLAGRHFAGQFDWSGPPQVEGNKLVFFGNVLCHSVRIIHTFEEFPLS
jgi:hypothetical protein